MFIASNIIVSPERFAVNSVGDDVLLSCTPSNTAISIIWYKGSELLTTSTKYTFSPAGRQHNLTINNAQHNDSGSYYCVFADSEIREDLKFDVIIIQGMYMVCTQCIDEAFVLTDMSLV